MMKKFFVYVFLIGLFFSPVAAYHAHAAGGGAGTLSADFLKFGAGARPIAMGNAFSALADEVSTLNYNPAGLANLNRHQVHYVFQNLVSGLKYNYLSYAHSLGRNGTLATAVSLLDYGDIQTTTMANPFGTGEGTFTGRDLMISFGYARVVLPRTAIGLQVKYIQEKLESVTAGAGAIDLGVLYYLPGYHLSLAAVIQNYGTKLTFYSKKERIPFTVRFGSAYRAYLDRLRITLDAHNEIGTGWNYNAGGEFWVVPHLLAVRTGFDSSKDYGSGLTAGAGFRYNDFDLDYAFVPTSDFGNSHRVSGTLSFGAVRSEPLLLPPEKRLEIAGTRSAVRRTSVSHPQKKSVEQKKHFFSNKDQKNISQLAPPIEDDEIKSESTDNLLNQAEDLYGEGKYINAVKVYKKILKHQPDNFNAAYNVATIYYQMHRWDLAADFYKKCQDINPYSIESNVYIGLSYYQLEDYPKARSAWERVLELDPTNTTAKNNLAALTNLMPY